MGLVTHTQFLQLSYTVQYKETTTKIISNHWQRATATSAKATPRNSTTSQMDLNRTENTVSPQGRLQASDKP